MNKRKRKMMMMLPVLVIPFLTLAFWAMGGGKKSDQPPTNKQGLNLHLPEANFKEDKILDKLGFYDKAEKDSMKMQEWMRSDPYYMHESKQISDDLELMTQTTATKYNQRLKTSPYEENRNDPEQKLMQRITRLQKEMNKPASYEGPDKQKELELGNEVYRLERMVQNVNTPPTEDPEMKQLEGTLDKILDIQHPERIKERGKEKSFQEKEHVFAVSKQSAADTNVKGFYGINKERVDVRQNAIEAVVHENQILVNGSIIRLRLTNDIYVNGSLIPQGNFIYGVASLSDERLIISINSIRYVNFLFPVKLEVYDMDGLPGIYIPGAISRDVAKQSADNSLQLMESTMDPSLKAQAATAGINTAKSLLSKKVKLVKVLVKANYKVLLKENL